MRSNLAIMAGRVAPCPEPSGLKALPPVSRLVSTSRLPADPAMAVERQPESTTMTIERPMFPPVDQTRRQLLTVAAGGAVAAAIPTTMTAAAAVDPAFALIAAKLAADVAHCAAIDAQDEADRADDPDAEEKAFQRCCVACGVVNEADWRLATTPPTTLAGVAAVLRFANEIEDGGMEWPDTDAIGPEGWHYQLRATMAAAIETIIRQMEV